MASPEGAVLGLLEEHENLIPADAAILARLLRARWAAAEIEAAVGALLAAGQLRRLYLGREPHLARTKVPAQSGAAQPAAQPALQRPAAVPAQPAAPAQGGVAIDQRAFQLQLAQDAEEEKVLLYKVLLAVLAVLGLALAREWVLWALR